MSFEFYTHYVPLLTQLGVDPRYESRTVTSAHQEAEFTSFHTLPNPSERTRKCIVLEARYC